MRKRYEIYYYRLNHTVKHDLFLFIYINGTRASLYTDIPSSLRYIRTQYLGMRYPSMWDNHRDLYALILSVRLKIFSFACALHIKARRLRDVTVVSLRLTEVFSTDFIKSDFSLRHSTQHEDCCNFILF